VRDDGDDDGDDDDGGRKPFSGPVKTKRLRFVSFAFVLTPKRAFFQLYFFALKVYDLLYGFLCVT